MCILIEICVIHIHFVYWAVHVFVSRISTKGIDETEGAWSSNMGVETVAKGQFPKMVNYVSKLALKLSAPHHIFI